MGVASTTSVEVDGFTILEAAALPCDVSSDTSPARAARLGKRNEAAALREKKSQTDVSPARLPATVSPAQSPAAARLENRNQAAMLREQKRKAQAETQVETQPESQPETQPETQPEKKVEKTESTFVKPLGSPEGTVSEHIIGRSVPGAVVFDRLVYLDICDSIDSCSDRPLIWSFPGLKTLGQCCKGALFNVLDAVEVKAYHMQDEVLPKLEHLDLTISTHARKMERLLHEYRSTPKEERGNIRIGPENATVELTLKDIATTFGKNWLNDSVIDSFFRNMDLYEIENGGLGCDDTCTMSSLFMTKLISSSNDVSDTSVEVDRCVRWFNIRRKLSSRPLTSVGFPIHCYHNH